MYVRIQADRPALAGLAAGPALGGRAAGRPIYGSAAGQQAGHRPATRADPGHLCAAQARRREFSVAWLVLSALLASR